MAKRLTDTEKWERPWFRELKTEYKLLWCYILDKCDIAGVWYVDFGLASFLIGTQYNRADAETVLEKQIVVKGDRWLIKDFISFQYGQLTEANKLHNNVALKLGQFNEGGYMPHKCPINGVKNKNKDKDKDIKGVVKGKVEFSQEEYQHLINTYGQSIIKEYIDRLNDYGLQFPAKFAKYHNHAAVIRQWLRKDNVKKLPPKEEKPKEDLRYRPEVSAMIHETAQKIGTKK